MFLWRWRYQYAPALGDELVKDRSLLLLISIVHFGGVERSSSPTRHNIAIGFQDPLSHFIVFSLCRSKDTAKNLTSEREIASVFTIVTPLVPAELAQVRDVAFFSSHQEMGVPPLKLEQVAGCQVANTSTTFNTVVLEHNRAI